MWQPIAPRRAVYLAATNLIDFFERELSKFEKSGFEKNKKVINSYKEIILTLLKIAVNRPISKDEKEILNKEICCNRFLRTYNSTILVEKPSLKVYIAPILQEFKEKKFKHSDTLELLQCEGDKNDLLHRLYKKADLKKIVDTLGVIVNILEKISEDSQITVSDYDDLINNLAKKPYTDIIKKISEKYEDELRQYVINQAPETKFLK